MSHFESKKSSFFSYSGDGLLFCSVQAFNGLAEAHQNQGGQLALLSLPELNVNLIQKHPHRHT